MSEARIGIVSEAMAPSDVVPLSHEARQVLACYEQSIAVPHVVNTGPATTPTPMYDGETPPMAVRDYMVYYPPALVEAYRIAAERYDQAFMQIVGRHKIWGGDYQFAKGTLAFQVDGPAYPDAFLAFAANISPDVLAEVVHARAFEYENNLAMYGLNARLWPDGTTNATWNAALDGVRQKTGRKVAVLAGTEQKLDEMVRSELYTDRGRMPSEDQIRELTGFDAFWGPEDLKKHFEVYGGQNSEYVFFGRTSMPKSWLKDPATQLGDRFLADPALLAFVRAFALTHNFDFQALQLDHPDVITDTKEALVTTGAAYPVTSPWDVYSSELFDAIADANIDINSILSGTLSDPMKKKLGQLFKNFPSELLLSNQFIQHLDARGVNPAKVASGQQLVRAKPNKLHYGVYGHLERGEINKAAFLNKLLAEIRAVGTYIIQPEFENLKIVDGQNPSEAYIAIDRIFLVRDQNGQLKPMESCRSMMPLSSQDGRHNNVHEGPSTRCARIVLE